MFEKLKSLIFGQGEFEKSKIEVRFLLAKEISLRLKIEKLEEFEILESCIYKIRELLRLKSSNLNKAISDSSRNIKKREVVELLEILDRVKNTYLKEVDGNTQSETRDKGQETREKKKEGEREFPKNIEIISKPEYTMMLGIEKIPYLLINFKSNLDFGLLKKVMVIFFEVYMPQGTNIIIEGSSVLILPRFAEDNLISFPTLNVNLETVYDVFQKNKLSLDKLKDKSLQGLKITGEEIISEKIYPELEKKHEKKSLKQKEESLDNLLEALNKKTYNREEQRATEIESLRASELNRERAEEEKVQNNDLSNNTDEDNLHSNIVNSNTQSGVRGTQKNVEKNFEIISEDSIEIVKKTKEDVLKEDIIIERKPSNINTLNKNTTTNSFSKSSSHDEGYDLEDYSLYIDDKIKVYLESKSKTTYEIVITTINEEKISDINELTFSYMMIFSKVFSQIVFEETKSDGTNFICDYSKNKLRIICRRENDGLKLNWDLKESSEDFLEQVKAKLFSEMSKGIQKDIEPQRQSTFEIKEGTTRMKERSGVKDIGIDFYDNGKGNVNNKRIRREIEEVNSSIDLFNELTAKKELKAQNLKKEEDKGVIKIDTALEKKAKYILEALRRIP